MTYDVWTGDGYTALPAATSGGETVMTPNINGLVYKQGDPSRILLQRRDKPGEVVRGRLELPGGRWRAGERPQDALAREILEETGVTVVEIVGLGSPYQPADGVAIATIQPRMVVSGYDGAYPSIHVVLECRGQGEPRPLEGETADPRCGMSARSGRSCRTIPRPSSGSASPCSPRPSEFSRWSPGRSLHRSRCVHPAV